MHTPDGSRSATSTPNSRIYVLRIWRGETPAGSALRVSVKDTASPHRRQFDTLDAVLEHFYVELTKHC